MLKIRSHFMLGQEKEHKELKAYCRQLETQNDILLLGCVYVCVCVCVCLCVREFVCVYIVCVYCVYVSVSVRVYFTQAPPLRSRCTE